MFHQTERDQSGMSIDLVKEQIKRFDSEIGVASAETPPAFWYQNKGIFELEKATVFKNSWQMAGPLEWLNEPGSYTTGEINKEPYVVMRDQSGELRGFYNVCRHHAACLLEGRGKTKHITCPYHGWTYKTDGKLIRAPHLGELGNFDRSKFGLNPIDVKTWGPMAFFTLAKRDQDTPLDPSGKAQAGLEQMGFSGLKFHSRVEYEIKCNWKVFVDNYLDGGYHVSIAHKDLASNLSLDGYQTEMIEGGSIQSVGATNESDPRIQGGALYVWLYPNLMINRYGPMMDVNQVIPLSEDRTLTVFDYYFDESVIGDEAFIKKSLESSDRVQQEDIWICESVQKGIESSGYDVGRYAPNLEMSAYQFHSLLQKDLNKALELLKK